MVRDNNVLILFSGGIDSTALIDYYIKSNYKVSALFFNYGQKSLIYEQQAVKKISKYYDIDVKEIALGFSLRNKKGGLIGRNALLLTASLCLIPEDTHYIGIGVHYGTPYYDCSDTFIKDYQRIIDGYFNGSVILEAPFLNFTKKQIIEYCTKENVNLSYTYSCELGSKRNCGKCLSCLDRKEFLNE